MQPMCETRSIERGRGWTSRGGRARARWLAGALLLVPALLPAQQGVSSRPGTASLGASGSIGNNAAAEASGGLGGNPESYLGGAQGRAGSSSGQVALVTPWGAQLVRYEQFGTDMVVGGDMLIPAPRQVDERTVVLQRAGDGHFYVTADVNGRPVRFLVDTGASSLVLSWRDAERVGIDIGALDFRVPSMTANGMVMSAPVRVGLIELGAFVDEDVRAMVNGGDLDVSLLGMSYLSRYRGFEVDGDRFFLKR